MTAFGVGGSLSAPFAHLYRHRALTLEMARREILDRYVGQMFGWLWAIGHPLLMVLVFVFVYQYVLAIRIGGSREMPLDYTTYLLSSMIPWLAFQEALNKGATALRTNASLVKQVVFPIEVLPIKTAVACFVSQLIGTACLVAWVMFRSHSLPATYCLLPVLWVLQMLAMWGTALMLSAIGAYFADLKDFVQVFGSIGIYLMPTVYLPDWVPAMFRPLLQFNPFSHMAWCYQDACYFGRIDHPISWIVFAVGSLVTFFIGWWSFAKLKTFFGSVL